MGDYAIVAYGPELDVTYLNATGSTISIGDLVVLGDQGLFGIARETIANAASGTIKVPGWAKVRGSAKGHNGTANAAISAYDKVYFTAGEAFVDVDNANTFVGWVLGDVASGATETEDIILGQALA